MNEDKYFKELFSNYHPQLTDDDAFMQKVKRQMELVEYVKAYQQEKKSKNKRVATIAFAIGVILGCVMGILSLLIPNPVEALMFGVKSEILLYILQNIRIITMLLGAAIMCASIFFILNITEETANHSQTSRRGGKTDDDVKLFTKQ